MQREILVEAIVEIPKGTRNKYRFDRETGFFRLDRVLYSPMPYPADYGQVMETRTGDGEPLGILILISEASFPGCLVTARVIGALAEEDGGGAGCLLVAVAAADPRYDKVQELRHLSIQSHRELGVFFHIQREMEGKKAPAGWRDAEFAAGLLAGARKAWREEEKRTGPARFGRRKRLAATAPRQ